MTKEELILLIKENLSVNVLTDWYKNEIRVSLFWGDEEFSSRTENVQVRLNENQ